MPRTSNDGPNKPAEADQMSLMSNNMFVPPLAPASASRKLKEKAGVVWGTKNDVNAIGSSVKMKVVHADLYKPKIPRPRSHPYQRRSGYEVPQGVAPSRLPTFAEIMDLQQEPDHEHDLLRAIRAACGKPALQPPPKPLPDVPKICDVIKREPIELKVPKFGWPPGADALYPDEPEPDRRMPYFALHKRFQSDERIGFEALIPNLCMQFMTGNCAEGVACAMVHELPGTDEIVRTLTLKGYKEVRQLFQVFVRRCDRLLRVYFSAFAQVFGQRKQMKLLLQMLGMLENRRLKLGSDDNYEAIYRGLHSASSSYANMLVNILINYPVLTEAFVNFIYHKSLGLRMKKKEFEGMINMFMAKPDYEFTPSVLNVLLPIADQVQDVEIIGFWVAVVEKNKLVGKELQYKTLNENAKAICSKVVKIVANH